MSQQQISPAATKEDLARFEKLVVGITVALASLAWYYATDVKKELQREIESSEAANYALIDRVRAESMERHNDVREELGKARIEFDALPQRR